MAELVAVEVSLYGKYVKSEFGVTDDAVPLLTYWVPPTMSVLDSGKNPPVMFSSNDGFSNYQAIRCAK